MPQHSTTHITTSTSKAALQIEPLTKTAKAIPKAGAFRQSRYRSSGYTGIQQRCFRQYNKNTPRTEAYAVIKLEPYVGRTTNLRGKVDSGAQGNILPLRTYKKIFPNSLTPDGRPTRSQPSGDGLTAYNGSPIQHYGTITMPCSYKDSDWVDTTFYIAETPGPVIFGLPTGIALNLLQMNCSVNVSGQQAQKISSTSYLQSMYPDCFEGLGKFAGTCKLTLKDDAQPIIHASRRAPVQLRDKIQAELDCMVKLDVIKLVTEPTDWVSSITYVMKADGSLRVCLDPKDLNRALKRGQHHIPTMEEIGHKFSGMSVFSKLDAKSGYWSVVLDTDSQLLTTFNTPFGRYCFKRLPFGLNVSQDVFQAAMDRNLEGLKGVISIADDIAVVGKDQADHDRNLHALMTRAQERGIVFNPKKCHIKTDRIMFFGNVYSSTGIHPDPAEVQAIHDLTPPTNAAQLQSFLGLITYLSAYIPNLSQKTAPLRQLLRDDNEFQWQPTHKAAFDNLKKQISEANSLTYFDPKKQTILQVDASQEALGAALVQDERIVAYASKSLTDTEKRYANMECELLACVFATECFHNYIYGKPVIIESDHKPLEMIAKKHLSAAPARLQRMLLRLQHYDYHIRYRPGHEMTLADSLSRLPTSKKGPQIQLDVKVCHIQFSKPRLNELRDETRKDEVFDRLKEHILTGFPERARDIHPSVRPFWNFRDELSIEDGLIIKGCQIVVPSTLRHRFLQDLHTAHQGVTRTQQRARSCGYWLDINKDI